MHKLLATLAGLVFAVALSSCTPIAPSPAPPQAVTVTGVVVNQGHQPVSQAAVIVGGRKVAETDESGAYVFTYRARPERLAISFSATGYVDTTRAINLPARGRRDAGPTTLLTSSRPTIVDAATGGTVAFGGGGTLTIPGNAFIDASGARVGGPVNVSVTVFDVADANGIRAAPGDFRARGADGKDIRLQSFGMFNVRVEDAKGRALSLAEGVKLPFTLRAPERLGRNIPARPGLYSLDPTTGYWIREAAVAQADPLVWAGTVTRVNWSWNIDDPMDTTCITVKVVRMDWLSGTMVPVPGATVDATGVVYLSTTSGTTNANGLVCLLVKLNAAVQISAYQQVGASTWMSPTNPVIQSPQTPAGAVDCGNPTLCPLVTTIEIDLLVGVH